MTDTTIEPGRRRGRVLVWLLLAPFALWALLRLTGVLDEVWPWVPLVAFTPYVAIGAVVALLLSLLSRRWTPIVVAGVTAVSLTAVALPRAFANAAPAVHGKELRVLAANLMVGQADTTDLIALVRQLKPDVLTLQELTPDARQRLDDAGLRTLLPYAVDRSREGASGSGIYASSPLTEQPLITNGVFNQARASINGMEIVSVHPCAPKLARRAACWSAGLRALPRGGGPLRILAGDFNATLDHGPVRDLLSSGYQDAGEVTGQGFTATWPQDGHVPGVVIDHVLADRRIAVRSYSVHPLKGTDHRPVFAELTLP